MSSTLSACCPACGTALPGDAPEGLCPACLLRSAARATPTTSEATGGFSPWPAPPLEEVVRLLPHLEILELLGQGGMGAVYKARQPSLDRLVAVKVLPPAAAKDPAFAERFQREAKALAKLNHPHIVGVHDIGHNDGLYYIVMEYVDGVDLRRLLRDGQLRPEEALRIVPQICEALQYAHDRGVVHRDIKPENVLVDTEGRVKIADFGLAKLLGESVLGRSLTGSRQVMGSLYYMAPEQVEKPQSVDHRADIYSLGVVFYELLTGELPVGRFEPPSERAGTDAVLDAVVFRALERQPERRYQRADDVRTDVLAARPAAAPPPAAVPPDSVTVAMAREELRMPALGLMVSTVAGAVCSAAGFLACLFVGLDDWQYGRNTVHVSNIAVVFLVALALNVVGGAVIFSGARCLRNLHAFDYAYIAACTAMIPITGIAYPISLLMGWWALSLLKKPEVRSAFALELRRRAEEAARRRVDAKGIPGRD